MIPECGGFTRAVLRSLTGPARLSMVRQTKVAARGVFPPNKGAKQIMDPLVLLPAMMCDARLFSHQINTLSQDRAVMIAPINRGERVEEIASNILDQLPVRFALAGVAMGGIVAMEVLRRAPDRVTRLCLMDCSPLPESPDVAAAREPWIIRAQSGRLNDVVQETLLPEHMAPGATRMEALGRLRQMAIEIGPETYVRQSRALQRRRDQQGTLRKCKQSTLILCGEHDMLVPVKRHEFMAELMPNAHLEVIPNAGHLPPLDQPEAVTDILRDWLA